MIPEFWEEKQELYICYDWSYQEKILGNLPISFNKINLFFLFFLLFLNFMGTLFFFRILYLHSALKAKNGFRSLNNLLSPNVIHKCECVYSLSGDKLTSSQVSTVLSRSVFTKMKSLLCIFFSSDSNCFPLLVKLSNSLCLLDISFLAVSCCRHKCFLN